MNRILLIVSFLVLGLSFSFSTHAATYSGTLYHQVIPGTNQYWSYPGTICATVANSTGNTFFLPAKTDSEFNSFLTHLPAGVTTSGCTASCPASGGCGTTAHNGTCTSYSASSVTSPAACTSVARTSTCNNGTWSAAPYANASCSVTMRSCAASGGCGSTAHNGSCTTYSSSAPSGAACSTVSRTSTCSDGTWSTTPYAYSSCSAGCAASGACGAASSGAAACTSYSVNSTTYPTACPAAISSTCSNGSWSTTPGAYGSCTPGAAPNCAASGGCPLTAHAGSCTSYSSSAVNAPAACSSVAKTTVCDAGTWKTAVGGSASTPFANTSCSVNAQCAASGGCALTAHNGSCTTYSSSAPSGAACSTVSRTSTCNNGTWSAAPYAFSSCNNGCATSGACSGAAHNSTCSSYANASVNYPASCSAISSTCSNGTWSPTPGSSSGCSVNHSYSWGAWGTCSGGNLTRTCYDYGNAVSGSLCTAAIGGVETRSCSTTYACATASGPCATGNMTLATTGPAPAGEPFASCSGTVTPLCAGGTVSYSGSAAGCSTSFSNYSVYTGYAATSCFSGTLPAACSNGTAKSMAVMLCYGGYAWSTGSWSTCGSGCTQTRSVTCVNQADGSTVADSSCTGTKPSTSQSCTGGSCPAAQVVYGNIVQGIQNSTCTGYNSPISSVTIPSGKTYVNCTYDYESPYNNFTHGNPNSGSYNSSTGVCSVYFQCQGGVLNGACYSSGWCNQYVIRARLEYR